MSMHRLTIAGFLLVAFNSVAFAAEIRMRATGAVQHTLIELAQSFERETGHRIKAAFGTAGAVSALISKDEPLDGGPVDLVFSSAASFNVPVVKAKLVDAPASVVGRVRIGIGVRTGDKAPDISTPDALKAALLAAPSFAYGDPATGATTGIHFAKLLDTMGIADAVKSKAVLRAGGLLVMKEVAEGKAAFGFTQTSEIKAVPGVVIAGYLPDAYQLITVYSGTLLKDATQADAARSFLAYVTGPAGQAGFKSHGFEVGP